MAFIVPEVTKSDSRCALSRADFGRQKDVYLLAKRKVASCRRLWDEFAREDPATARLVVAEVTAEKVKDQEATRHLDLVLSKGEKKGVTKNATKDGKPGITKAERKTAKEIRKAMRPPVTPESLLNKELQITLRTSGDPAEREAARELLGRVTR